MRGTVAMHAMCYRLAQAFFLVSQLASCCPSSIVLANPSISSSYRSRRRPTVVTSTTTDSTRRTAFVAQRPSSAITSDQRQELQRINTRVSSLLRIKERPSQYKGFSLSTLSAPISLTKSARTTSQLYMSNKRARRATTKTSEDTSSDTAAASSTSSSSSSSSSSVLDSSWLWSLCLPLWLVYVSNQWSRSSLYYLVDFSSTADAFKAMNVDIGFNEGQYGLLASVAFTILFAIASLGAGVASDRYDRKLLTVISAASWSVATFGTAASDTYTQVALFRILMGLACAFSTPTAYTLIQERVPKQRQSVASSFYGTGVSVASGLASLSILLDNQFGWRQALDIIALFGFGATAINVLVLPSDDKQQSKASEQESALHTTSKTKATSNNAQDDDSSSSILADVSSIVSTDRVRWLFLGSFLRFCSGLCIGVWSAPFYRMSFAGNESSYSVAQALISVVGASASGLLGGAIADWLSADDTDEDAVGKRLWVPVVGSLLAAPAWYFAVQTNQPFETAMFWLAVEYFVAECWFGPTISTLQATVLPGRGGTAQGLFTLTGAIANFAPTILGYIYGQLTNVAEAAASTSGELSTLLSAAVCFGYLSSALCFAFASQSKPPISIEAETKQQ